MESTFQNFELEYQIYSNIEGHFLIQRHLNAGNNQFIDRLNQVTQEFKNVDVKMRLAFGISEIRLNNSFVLDKEGDLKLCHLLYYKLADLWFAYESYIKLFKTITAIGKNKIT